MELNEKLARWAGIKTIEALRLSGIFFPDSLDLCFQWLVPKIDMLWNIEFQLLDKGYVAVLEYGSDREIVGKAETPALALCKAIEQYIEEVEK